MSETEQDVQGASEETQARKPRTRRGTRGGAGRRKKSEVTAEVAAAEGTGEASAPAASTPPAKPARRRASRSTKAAAREVEAEPVAEIAAEVTTSEPAVESGAPEARPVEPAPAPKSEPAERPATQPRRVKRVVDDFLAGLLDEEEIIEEEAPEIIEEVQETVVVEPPPQRRAERKPEPVRPPAFESREKPEREARVAREPVEAVEAVEEDFTGGLEVEAGDSTAEAESETTSGAPAGEEQREGERRRRRGRRRRGRGRRNREGENGGEATDEARPQGQPPQQQQQQRREPAQSGRGPQEQQRGGRRDDRRRQQAARPEPVTDEFEDESTESFRPTGDRQMLVNVAEGEECRIAVVHQRRLEELFIERASAESHVGNIYKGRVTNVEPSIQAAFIDFGLPKNGFLHISDVQPQYFPDNRGRMEEVGRKTPRRERPPIQKCLRRGQEVIVQIIKEGIGTKGPTLTTYISIPGRYLVMMPGMNRLGVSRKIEDEDARRKMRAILDELDFPKDMGFILRTAGMDKTKAELKRDQMYLLRLWKMVAQRIKTQAAPCELYRESDLVIRTIRDIYSSDFSKIIVDDAATAEKIRDFLSIAMPRASAPVELYTGTQPLFHKYDIEREIERINARHVPLPSGGSLVIDSTEALVAIDVNSGRYRDLDDAEETAYRINLEAAEEIARQLLLRDLGGLILCDFIDMRLEKHRRGVERALREALKKHKERAKCLRMSQFGIIEMTRQRTRPSIKRSIYQDCPHCRGSGLVKNPESMTLDIMRLLRLAAYHQNVDTVEVRVSPQVAFHLQNRKRAAIHELEQSSKRRIIIRADNNMGLDQYHLDCVDARGGSIRVIEPAEQPMSPAEARSKRLAQSSNELRFEGRESFEDAD